MIYTSYHVFSDHIDEWVATRKQADELYRFWRDVEGRLNIRIYKCVSTDEDVEVEETYIKGRGDFPW